MKTLLCAAVLTLSAACGHAADSASLKDDSHNTGGTSVPMIYDQKVTLVGGEGSVAAAISAALAGKSIGVGPQKLSCTAGACTFAGVAKTPTATIADIAMTVGAESFSGQVYALLGQSPAVVARTEAVQAWDGASFTLKDADNQLYCQMINQLPPCAPAHRGHGAHGGGGQSTTCSLPADLLSPREFRCSYNGNAPILPL